MSKKDFKACIACILRPQRYENIEMPSTWLITVYLVSCPKIFREPVLHLLKYTANLYFAVNFGYSTIRGIEFKIHFIPDKLIMLIMTIKTRYARSILPYNSLISFLQNSISIVGTLQTQISSIRTLTFKQIFFFSI